MSREYFVLAIKEAMLSLSGLLITLLFHAMLAQALALLSKRAEETHKDNLRILFFSRMPKWC